MFEVVAFELFEGGVHDLGGEFKCARFAKAFFGFGVFVLDLVFDIVLGIVGFVVFTGVDLCKGGAEVAFDGY